MALESEIIQFGMNNGVGVLFGLLMFWMSNNTIKKNTVALEKLVIAIDKKIKK